MKILRVIGAFGIVALAVLIVLALPVIIPLVFICQYREKRRLRAAAERAECPSCGATLGVEALHRADDYWRSYVAGLRRDQPGVKFRLVRVVQAICGDCGAMLSFQNEKRTFIVSSGDQTPTGPRS
jgi:hypothetical protein